MQRRYADVASNAAAASRALKSNTVDVIVISTDEALITTLQESATASHAFWHAPSVDAAIELLVGGRCGILIADMQQLRADATASLERLQSQFPELVLLATGRREEESRVAGLVSKGYVYRFLHKPVSPARANLFLATATRRYHELSQNSPSASGSGKETGGPGNRFPVIAGGIAATVVAVVAATYLLRAEPEAEIAPPVAAAPAPSTAPPVVVQPAIRVDEVLAAAQSDFSAGRLSAPAGSNALERYRSVLAIESGNAAALNGVQEVLDALELQMMQALRARDAAAAARAYSVLRQAQPDHPQLGSLNEQLLALSRSIRPEPAKPVAAPRPAAAQSTPNLQRVRDRIASGLLIAPENDSAVSYLRAARSVGENASVTRILATDVGSRVLRQARLSLTNGNIVQARALYDDAAALDQEFSLGLPNATQVGNELKNAEAAGALASIESQLAPVVLLRESGNLIEPAGNNAFDLLQALAERAPDAAPLRAEQQRLAFTLLDHARTALAQGSLDRASLLASRAELLVNRTPAVRAVQEQIAAAQQEREAASRVVQAGELPRTREVAASYPADAERRGVEGWVDVEFTIDAGGTPRDLVVRSAQPAAIFDKAAVEALAKWRFQPIVRNGKPVQQRAVLRIRFALK